MNLGAFSISLNVKDVDASVDFYERLGFRVIDGGHTSNDFPDQDTQRWRIMQCGGARVGLFQGMFDANLMTFAPPDMSRVRRALHESGVLDQTAAEDGAIMLKDPDGNALLFDAH